MRNIFPGIFFILHFRNLAEFKCEYCSYTCKSTNVLSNHKNRRHAHNTPGSSSTKLEKKQSGKGNNDKMEGKGPKKEVLIKTLCKPNFKCALCNGEFVRRDSLRSHLNQHKSLGNYYFFLKIQEIEPFLF